MKFIFCLLFCFFVLLPGINFSKDFKGAELRTLDSYLFGRIEARYKSTNKEGILASFFTYFDGTPTEPWATYKWNEIDVEILGRYNNNVQFNTITPGQAFHIRANYLDFDPSQDYHTYAIEWTPDYVAWFIDDVEVYKQTGDFVKTLIYPQKIMMNIWNPVYENWVGVWNPDVLPAFAFYDWVSYYSYTPGSGDYGTSNNFSIQWKDDFDSLNTARWEKGIHTFGGNNCDFIDDNCVFKDGKMILCLTDASNIGFVDKTKPTVLWVRADDEKHITVRFSEAINKTTAESISNYIIQNVKIDSVSLQSDNRTVKLSVTGYDLSQSYGLIVMNIKDTASTPNTMSLRSLTIINSEQLSFPIKINVGGDSAQGFLPDQLWNENNEYGYMEGNSLVYPFTRQINNTDLDSVYLSSRCGLNSYRVRVPNGKYNVRLMFAEERLSEIGKRIFDVYVEGNLIENNLDIYSRVSDNTAFDIIADSIQVNDGILEINLCAEIDSAQLNGIVIEDLTTGLNNRINNVPNQFKLEQNYPNPFNGMTKINYYNNKQQNLKFIVYDILGRQVFFKYLGMQQKGYNQFTWDSKNSDYQTFSSGVYFYSIVGEEIYSVKKLVLLK